MQTRSGEDPVAAPRSAGSPVVYLHIGAPKTGTTFLQEVLWRNREVLAAKGVMLPGRGVNDHFRATADLGEMPQPPDDPAPSWIGEWDALAARALRLPSPTVVISHELLAAATTEQVKRAAESLAPAELHVIYAVRNLADLLPAEYQEFVKHRYRHPLDEWLAEIVDSGTETGDWFWRVHDGVDVLRRWSAAAPAERIHVLTMPRPGSPPDLLWWRFAAILDVDPEDVDFTGARTNSSLGVVEAELLRRINVVLDDDEVPQWRYPELVRDIIAHELLAARPGARRITLPTERVGWVRERSQQLVDGFAKGGYHVVGNLDDLVAAPGNGDGRYADATDPELFDAAVDTLSRVIGYMARVLPRPRHPPPLSSRPETRFQRFAWRLAARYPALLVLRPAYRTSRMIWAKLRPAKG